MTGKIRTRLVVLAALAALAAVLVPAGFALGDSEPAFGPGEVIYLSLGNGQNADQINFGDDSQDVPTKNNDCTVIDSISTDSDDSILVISELRALSLGESKDHIGTLGPNDGFGEPCALAAAGAGVDGANEGISVVLGSAVDPSVVMNGFSIDVRLKGTGATVEATFWLGENEVNTDLNEERIFTKPGADSGPDSADNYRWTLPDLDPFDRVEFEATTGAFALGGGDESNDPGAFDSTGDLKFASQFQTLKEFDGDITCGENVSIVDPLVDVDGVVTMHALFDGTVLDPTWDPDCTKLKLYNDDVTDTSLFFLPELENTNARYTLVFTAENQVITTVDGQITSLIMDYSPSGDFESGDTKGMQACNGQPELDPNQPAYNAFWSETDVELLPDGETACYYSATVTPTGIDVGTEVWGIYFEDDPGFSVR